MSIQAVERFFVLLTLLAQVIVLVGVGAAVMARRSPAIRRARESIAPGAIWIAWAVAATCMAGSLYLSEVAHYPPCVMCWYQRICMYPLAVILLIAAVRRRRDVAMYAVPLAAIGAAISTYHYLHERFPDSVSTTCSAEVPCSYTWIWELHYISIPMMALSGFLAIITLLLSAPRDLSKRDLPVSDPSNPSPEETLPMSATS